MSTVPTVQELLELSYGKEFASAVPLVADLLTLPYAGGSANMKGFTGESYREGIVAYGQRVAWYQAVEAKDAATANEQGKIFVRKPLGVDVRVDLLTPTQTVQGEEFGEIKVGQSRMAYMPDEITPRRDDRFVNLDGEPKGERQTVHPSSAGGVALNRQYVVFIDAVYDGQGVALRPSTYWLDGNVLRWIGEPPDAAVAVLYTALPEYEWLDENVKSGFIGTDGVRLPTYGDVRLLIGGEE